MNSLHTVILHSLASISFCLTMPFTAAKHFLVSGKGSTKCPMDSQVRRSPVRTRKRKMTLEELRQLPAESIAILGKVYDEAKQGTKQLYEREAGHLRKRRKDTAVNHSVPRLRPDVQTREAVSGWILSRSQMRFLSEKEYLYNASAGSVLELAFLQRFVIFVLVFCP